MKDDSVKQRYAIITLQKHKNWSVITNNIFTTQIPFLRFKKFILSWNLYIINCILKNLDTKILKPHLQWVNMRILINFRLIENIIETFKPIYFTITLRNKFLTSLNSGWTISNIDCEKVKRLKLHFLNRLITSMVCESYCHGDYD